MFLVTLYDFQMKTKKTNNSVNVRDNLSVERFKQVVFDGFILRDEYLLSKSPISDVAGKIFNENQIHQPNVRYITLLYSHVSSIVLQARN